MRSSAGRTFWLAVCVCPNFINSTRFASFVKAYGQTILFNLRHLRACHISFDEKNVQALQSFGRLERLDLIHVMSRVKEVELNMPVLNNIHLERVDGIEKLMLEAPRLWKMSISECGSLRLNPVKKVKRS